MDSEETDSGSDSNPPISGDVATLSQFIENMGLHFEDYGIPRIGGKILGLLMVSQRPVSSEEMSEVLQASRSSISTNLRTLLMTGLADRVSLFGERSDYYVFSDEAWETALEMRLEGIQSLREMAEEGLHGMAVEDPARQRLEEVLDWTNLVEDAYEKLIKKWQSRKEVPA
jgi:DNA-binding transcriptional regulator GbsR (MarR family)